MLEWQHLRQLRSDYLFWWCLKPIQVSYLWLGCQLLPSLRRWMEKFKGAVPVPGVIHYSANPYPHLVASWPGMETNKPLRVRAVVLPLAPMAQRELEAIVWVFRSRTSAWSLPRLLNQSLNHGLKPWAWQLKLFIDDVAGKPEAFIIQNKPSGHSRFHNRVTKGLQQEWLEVSCVNNGCRAAWALLRGRLSQWLTPFQNSPAMWTRKKLDLRGFISMKVSHSTNKESLIRWVGTSIPFLLSQRMFFPSGYMGEVV